MKNEQLKATIKKIIKTNSILWHFYNFFHNIYYKYFYIPTLFKKFNNINVIFSEIDNYKVAGDLLFYINLLEIGNIYFCSKSLNYHRRHEDSIVKTVNNKIHFNEIVAIQNYISNKYDLSKEISNKVQLYRTIVKKYLKV